MRPLRLLTAVLLAVTVLALPADAATPTTSIRASSLSPVYGTAVTISGRVTHVPTGTRIQFQRNLGTGWVTRAYLRTSSTGRWSTTYSARLGQNHLRIVVPAKGSRRRVVSSQVVVAAQPRVSPKPPVANEPVTVTGALRTAGSRPVQVQVYSGGTTTITAGTTRSSGAFTVTTELPGTAKVRIIAPAVTGSDPQVAFSTPWVTVTVTAALVHVGRRTRHRR